MSRARRAGALHDVRRLLGVGTLAALVVAGVLLGSVGPSPAPRTSLQPAGLADAAAPAAAESSSWFCTGGSGPADRVAPSRLLLVNAGAHPATGTLHAVDEKGQSASASFRVPAHGEVAEAPGSLVSGKWLATSVTAGSGTLSAAELVKGATGWSVAPCASETSPRWFFASGSTQGGTTMRVFLYNPSTNLAVVDLSFATASGIEAPAPFQGIVLAPGHLETATVGAYVQNQEEVGTVVRARSGAVVAAELELFGASGASGVALRLGAPAVEPTWALPAGLDSPGGASELAILNPTSVSERVHVDVRLASGPVTPFEQVVGPASVWTIDTGAQVRILAGSPFAALVTANGPGVVVARSASGTPGSAQPLWRAEGAVQFAQSSTTRQWVVPALSPAAGSATTSGQLALANPGHRKVQVTVETLGGTGSRGPRRLRIDGGSFALVEKTAAPLVVSANGTLGVVDQVTVAGLGAPVQVPAVPQRSGA